MSNKEKNNKFAYITIVAIVAIVAITFMISGKNAGFSINENKVFSEMPSTAESSDLVGEPTRPLRGRTSPNKGTPEDENRGNPENICTGCIAQRISLKTGWNMISFNVDMPDKSFKSVFSSMNPENNEEVKTGLYVGTFYNGKWYGTTTVDLSEAYMVKVFKSKTLTVYGKPIPLSTKINLNKDWNWVPYYPTQRLNTNVALKNILPYVTKVVDGNNNVVSTMIPGKGYQIQVSKACTLDYSKTSGVVCPAGCVPY